MFFRKKPKVTFHCKLPEVLEQYPIVPAKSVKFNWLRQSAVDFKNMAEQKGKYESVAGTVKCSGLQNIMQRGWILSSWFDLTIRTSQEDGDRFDYAIPTSIDLYLNETKWKYKLVSWFSDSEAALRVPMPQNSLQSLIKIGTPWTVSVPKGQALLMMPLPYPDQPEFSAVHGIIEPGDFYDINAIIAIHRRPGELFIPAGTPLCQMMVIDLEDPAVEQQVQSPQNRKDELKTIYRNAHRFITRKENT
jgi:hypothetical protein